jgi:hypothetical protein
MRSIMIFWGALWGAIVGGLLSTQGLSTWIVGALLGSLAGKMLQSAIHITIDERWQALNRQRGTKTSTRAPPPIAPSAPENLVHRRRYHRPHGACCAFVWTAVAAAGLY